MSFDVERRQHERYYFPYTVEYLVNHHSDDQIFKGIIVNINDYGLCLCVSDPLCEGQEITIRSILPVTYQIATVRWSKKVDTYYRVGLMRRG